MGLKMISGVFRRPKNVFLGSTINVNFDWLRKILSLRFSNDLDV